MEGVLLILVDLAVFLAIPQLCLKHIDLRLELFNLLELLLVYIAFLKQQVLLNLDFLLFSILAVTNNAHFVLLQDIIVLPQLGVLVRHLLHFGVSFNPKFVLVLSLRVGILTLLFERIYCFLHLGLVFLKLLDGANFVT